ncbi:hypothetical protein GGR58DRAFT_451075 [Xylaria digitata]|nr:hypothetical protein GGR58DRAFT_451075 [Xylaria digitata]
MMSFPFEIIEHTIPTQHIREWPRATAVSQDDVLQVRIKQYRPVDNPNPQPGDVTVIRAHANGFPKEVYEPLWADFHTESKKNGFRIRGIWIADVAYQGQSGLLNKDRLGNDPSWYDHARDLLYMTNVFRAEMPRPIIGIGHSFGGSILTCLSLIHARLFSTLILLDPVIHRSLLTRRRGRHDPSICLPPRYVAHAGRGGSSFPALTLLFGMGPAGPQCLDRSWTLQSTRGRRWR